MARIQATFFFQGCVLVKDEASIDRLQRSGIGARQLNPIITSLASNDAPLPTSGPLLLLDEEAFYLTHHGLLDVESSVGEVASLDFLWTAFVKRNANFPVKFKVFAYYKDKSYVVRSGMNFGVDYCAYHTLPSLCHSEMCITVVDATRPGPGSAQDDTAHTTNATVSAAANATAAPLNLAWRHVTTLTRVVPDVNKICVICYVLPTADAPHQAAPVVTSSIDTSSVADDVCMKEDVASGSGSGADVGTDSAVTEVAAPTVSPYLATLFPTATNTTNTTTSTTTNTTPIDFTSHTCLSLLTVRPVTALVRRMPALCETHQTIKMIQEAYHAASTAQKKREIKALNKAKFKNNNSGGNSSGGGDGNKDGKNEKYKKPYTRVSASASTSNSAPTATTIPNTNTSTPTITPAPTTITITNTTTDPTALLTADPATLSGRQKRIVKFLHKEALRASSTSSLPHDTTSTTTLTSALPKSKQMKERRDHRENRTKVMSNKNQSLLNMMQEHGKSSSDALRSNSGSSAAACSKADVSEGVDGSSVGSPHGDSKHASEVEECHVSGSSADTAGVKRRHGDANTDIKDSSALSFFANLFYPSNATTNTSTETGTTGSDTEGRRKRCRTQYTQGSGTTTEVEDGNEGYLRRAASYCVIS